MSSHGILPDDTPGRRLTGWMFLGILTACFGVVFAFNFAMAYYAISTFRGETDPSPYEHGLAYEKDIVAARAQAARGWNVSGRFTRDGDETAVQIRVLDPSGAPLTGLKVAAGFNSPADMKLDKSMALSETAPGVYLGRVSARAGHWDLELEAKRDGQSVFKSHNRIALR